jgi:hypothetical protein
MTIHSVTQIFEDCAKKAGHGAKEVQTLSKKTTQSPITVYFDRLTPLLEPILFGNQPSEYFSTITPYIVRLALLPFFTTTLGKKVFTKELLQSLSRQYHSTIMTLSLAEMKKPSILSAIIVDQAKWQKNVGIWSHNAAFAIEQGYSSADTSLSSSIVKSLHQSVVLSAGLLIDFLILSSHRYDQDMVNDLKQVITSGCVQYLNGMYHEFRKIVVTANTKAYDLFSEDIFKVILNRIAAERFPIFGEYHPENEVNASSKVTKEFLRHCNKMTVIDTFDTLMQEDSIGLSSIYIADLKDITKDLERQALRLEYISLLAEITEAMYPAD